MLACRGRAAAPVLVCRASLPRRRGIWPSDGKTPDYLRYYFIDRHLLGFATATQPHGDQPWWYYLPILLGGGLPWIGYLPVLIRGEGRGRAPRI